MGDESFAASQNGFRCQTARSGSPVSVRNATLAWEVEITKYSVESHFASVEFTEGLVGQLRRVDLCTNHALAVR